MFGEIILFELPNFQGRHKHLFASEPGLEDRVSSMAILSGSWRLCQGPHFVAPYPGPFGVGLYPDVTAYGVRDAGVSSVEQSPLPPAIEGEPIPGHAILSLLP